MSPRCRMLSSSGDLRCSLAWMPWVMMMSPTATTQKSSATSACRQVAFSSRRAGRCWGALTRWCMVRVPGSGVTDRREGGRGCGGNSGLAAFRVDAAHTQGGADQQEQAEQANHQLETLGDIAAFPGHRLADQM